MGDGGCANALLEASAIALSSAACGPISRRPWRRFSVRAAARSAWTSWLNSQRSRLPFPSASNFFSIALTPSPSASTPSAASAARSSRAAMPPDPSLSKLVKAASTALSSSFLLLSTAASLSSSTRRANSTRPSFPALSNLPSSSEVCPHASSHTPKALSAGWRSRTGISPCSPLSNLSKAALTRLLTPPLHVPVPCCVASCCFLTGPPATGPRATVLLDSLACLFSRVGRFGCGFAGGGGGDSDVDGGDSVFVLPIVMSVPVVACGCCSFWALGGGAGDLGGFPSTSGSTRRALVQTSRPYSSP
mmetsp:Transcript_14235/g.41771  ORF Transcript_14235/g.41771 Transcript_14235/m.41771 type:complete len:305 (+) Transcript_14235:1602-2516(+)